MTEITTKPKCVIGDTETAGLGEFKKIVEIGLMEICPDTLDVIDSISSLIDPGIPIQAGASAIHGITDAMVASAPTMDEFVQHTLGGGVPGEITLICHNVPFDKPLLLPIGNITRTLCTLAESRQIQSLMPGLANCKLQTLREYFGIEANSAHRALDDCEITRQVLKHILQLTGRTIEDLAAAVDRTIHVFPFGKHQGVPIMQMSARDIRWKLDNLELEDNLRRSLEKALALK